MPRTRSKYCLLFDGKSACGEGGGQGEGKPPNSQSTTKTPPDALSEFASPVKTEKQITYTTETVATFSLYSEGIPSSSSPLTAGAASPRFCACVTSLGVRPAAWACCAGSPARAGKTGRPTTAQACARRVGVIQSAMGGYSHDHSQPRSTKATMIDRDTMYGDN